MAAKEATARIKINKLLEAAGGRLFAEGDAPANIRLESNATLTTADLDAFGENFEKICKGFIDFLLLAAKGFPLNCSRSVIRGQKPARRQGTDAQIY